MERERRGRKRRSKREGLRGPERTERPSQKGRPGVTWPIGRSGRRHDPGGALWEGPAEFHAPPNKRHDSNSKNTSAAAASGAQSGSARTAGAKAGRDSLNLDTQQASGTEFLSAGVAGGAGAPSGAARKDNAVLSVSITGRVAGGAPSSSSQSTQQSKSTGTEQSGACHQAKGRTEQQYIAAVRAPLLCPLPPSRSHPARPPSAPR